MSETPTPTPTGRLLRTPEGVDLVLTRAFALPVEEVWAAVTEPARTARWFGPWEGDGAPGGTARVRMVFEEQEPWIELRVEACEAPYRLVVSTADEAGAWNLELKLAGTSAGAVDVPGGTEIQLIQHRESAAGLGEIGAGWEVLPGHAPRLTGRHPAARVRGLLPGAEGVFRRADG
ncbi:SRPBCC domain-containing protein [Streptomyces sp. NBC_01506]|uniref:SRPBCC domain-containing protein n=1 Tax=Streptomyces sp. NBC_01506 TaxID=2903887 RepID=UPI0038669F94